MKNINYDKLFEIYIKVPDVYLIQMKMLDFYNKEQLIEFKNWLEDDWNEQLFKFSDSNNLNEEILQEYIDNGIDNGIPYSLKTNIDNRVKFFDLTLNGIDERFKELDKVLGIMSKESDYFDINDLLKAENK